MRRISILILLTLVACSSDSENTTNSITVDEPEDINEEVLTEEEEPTEEIRILKYPGDFDIGYLFACMNKKGITQIPYPQNEDNKTLIEFDDEYDQEYIEAFESASRECEEEMRNQGSGNESENNESNEDQSFKNVEVNTALECKKPFYSGKPQPVKEDSTFFYYRYYWQGKEKICYNYYEAEIIDDDLENQVKLLFDGINEELGLYVPINLTLVDQVKASAVTLRQISIDDCTIYNFLKSEDIEQCADMADPWGNRFAAAGVDWNSTANGGNVALFVDNWESYGYEGAIKVFAHEYFHIHQNGLLFYFEEEKLFGISKAWAKDPSANIFNDTPSKTYKIPNWIEEGGAEFAGPILATKYDKSINARRFFEENLDEARIVISTAVSNGDTVSLRDYEFAGYLYESDENPNNGIAREFAYQYTGGQWAHVYLWSLDDANYEKLMLGYYKNWAENESKNPEEGWKVTFEELFDMSVEDFYKDFDEFMLKDKEYQMSILPSNEVMQNTVLNR